MIDKYVLDCEVYTNYFLVAFKGLEQGRIITIEVRGEDSYISDKDDDKLRSLLSLRETFGFNSLNYDIPIIMSVLEGNTCRKIKEMSDFIIDNDMVSWQSLEHFGLKVPKQFKHFDIKEVAPGVAIGLKLYGARLNSKRLQDLPYEPSAILTESEMDNVKNYCINDLETTIDLYHNIEGRIELRRKMSDEYQINLLSKSDAQIAEAVMKSELKKILHYNIKAPDLEEGTTFNYNPPDFIKFENEELNSLLEFVRNHKFELDKKGSIVLPKELEKLEIIMGKSKYKIGIGGLHSTESKMVVKANENELLIDKDVASFYPKIILNLGIYPKHLGEQFLVFYNNIVEKRLKAKKEGYELIDIFFKIVINGLFGKFGNKYSCLYSPGSMLAVTLTGQLSLLMLIEQIENIGINVVSANTDGFVSLVPKKLLDDYQDICNRWQERLNFTLEETRYKALYSRDVNNYLAIKEDGKTKNKGIFNLGGISKNPAGDISVIAVIERLIKSTPIFKTINECNDITKFLHVSKVTGGAIWNDNYLGKVVRWVYTEDGQPIYRKKDYGVMKYSGDKQLKKGVKLGKWTMTKHKVANSDGATPMMTLGNIPHNLDRGKYIADALEILKSIGIN